MPRACAGVKGCRAGRVNPLAHGTYTVAYHVVSADSHPVAGAYTFSIGATSTTSVSASGTGSASSGPVAHAYLAGRFGAYAGLLLLVGGACSGPVRHKAAWKQGTGMGHASSSARNAVSSLWRNTWVVEGKTCRLQGSADGRAWPPGAASLPRRSHLLWAPGLRGPDMCHGGGREIARLSRAGVPSRRAARPFSAAELVRNAPGGASGRPKRVLGSVLGHQDPHHQPVAPVGVPRLGGRPQPKAPVSRRSSGTRTRPNSAPRP